MKLLKRTQKEAYKQNKKKVREIKLSDFFYMENL